MISHVRSAAHDYIVGVHCNQSFIVGCTLVLGLLSTVGCGDRQFKAISTDQASFSGSVYGGQQPIAGATIQLYAAGDTGDRSTSTPLITKPTVTNNRGEFNLGSYTCPSSSTNVYLTAVGGSPGLASGKINPNLTAMVALGACGNIASSTYISVSELSTVAAVYALARFMKSYSAIGSGPMDSQLMADSFQMAGEMVNTGTGAVPGVGLPRGQTVPSQKLRALANILSACSNSAGGTAGDGSICGSLFSLATSSSGVAPTETIGALQNIAENPTTEVVPLYLLSAGNSPFQPALTNAPLDWTLAITSTTPSPTLSPAPGMYTSVPAITLSDADTSAPIYYTSDGSMPTTASELYNGAISLSATAIIRTIAVAAGISSLPVAGTYIRRPSISITPPNVRLTPFQKQAFTAIGDGASTGVTWSLNPVVGSLSAGGLYTAPALVTAAQTVSVTATSLDGSAVSASSTVSLVPPVSVTITPASSSLIVGQTLAFTAAVSDVSNSAVTWSVSPNVGTVSTTGVYTAPTSLSDAQTLTVTATSVADPSVSATSTLSLIPSLTGRTYYLSPIGKEANNGLSATTPWLTPNHPGLNCGDTIVAASGNYNAMTITTTPNCSVHNAVWVKCATFDTCKVNQAVYSQGGIDVHASFWAFLGWEVTSSSGPYASCFTAVPSNGATSSIHDIYFINDIANGCIAGGFVTAPNGKASVDYFAAIADIAYNTAQGSAYCYSGVSVYQPVATDNDPGTHIYASQIFAWHNLEPPICAGTSSTDGEGIIFDTFNGAQSGLSPYGHQAAIENVITVYNGSYGVLAGGGSGNSIAPMYVRNATAYGNFINTNQNQSMCGQLASIGWPTTKATNANRYTTFTNNLAVSQSAKLSGCGSNTPYAYYFGNVDGTDKVYGNAGYSASGGFIGYTGLTTGFVANSNLMGTNPSFENPAEPPAPSCSTRASVIDCMSTVIADFTPTNAAYAEYGYQAPTSTLIYDVLFPQWLCGNPNMPLGLVTMGCLRQ